MAKEKKKRKKVGRKSQIKIKRQEKNVKQYAKFALEKDVDTFKELCQLIINAKNYMYSRLAGIRNYHLLFEGRKIRNEWVKDKELVEQFKLPARFWKSILEDVMSNLKSLWSNTRNRIKEAVRENKNLSDDEKFYIRYICSVPELFGNVLQKVGFVRPKKIKDLRIDERKIHNLMNRYARRYRGKTPYTSKNTFAIDKNMYEYVKIDGKVYIEMSNQILNNRIRLEVSDKNMYGKNIRVNFDGEKVTLGHTLKTKIRPVTTEKNVVAGDKGYRTMLTASSGRQYGIRLNEMMSKETERLNELNAKRNQLREIAKKARIDGDFEKARRIEENNLGKKKYNKNKNRFEEKTKSFINREINRFIKEEKPTEVILEDLTFVSWTKGLPKHVKRKLVRWVKGYIDERMVYKFDSKGIKTIHINPAYTSQECHKCGCLGERKGEKFTCKTCGIYHADINAAKVILKRSKDKEITLYTPYKKVKEILEKRSPSEKTS